MFLGLDSSTQSLTAVVIDPGAGRIVRTESVNFGAELPHYGAPNGFIPGGAGGEVHADPRMWLEALDLLLGRLGAVVNLDAIEAVAVSGQQHGSVYLDASFPGRLGELEAGQPLAGQLAPALARATSPIWMDTSTGVECAEIAAVAGGPAEVCRRTGSVAIERFTGPQIRRFAKTDPAGYERTAHIQLVSSFIASVLAGRPVAIDFGDGAGMNLMNLGTLAWDEVMLDATAPDLRRRLPELDPSDTVAGRMAGYFVHKFGFARGCRVVLGTGDNPSSLVGMGATAAGNVVISLGTSDTLFAAMAAPRTDPQGFGHVFGNPAGGFMSLTCFRNGSLAREALRDRLGLDWGAFDHAGLALTQPGNQGNLMLPFHGPEITPRHDFAGPVLRGSAAFEAGEDPPALVRALLEGQFLNMRLHTGWMGLAVDRILLTGGASRNDGIAQLVADIFQAPVERLAVADSAALGAALRAAHACGHQLEPMYAAMCAPDRGSRLAPDPALAALYEDALGRFGDLLAEVV